MAVSDFQSLMLPLLEHIADGRVHRVRDLMPTMAAELGLTAFDRDQLLPSGSQRVLDNRVFWAATYLKKAGLLESPQRGHVLISDEGRRVLAEKPARITIALLSRYPSFQAFRARGTRASTIVGPTLDEAEAVTPEESLEATWVTLRASLGQDLLGKIKQCSPTFFERLVVDLLVRMGYGGAVADAGATVGAPGDEGIDGVIKEDKLGLDVVYVQAKRWENQVGRPTVQAFAGSLEGKRARKGVMITTSWFSNEAKTYVNQIEKRIVLVDGESLVNLMMDYGVGVSTAKTYLIQRIDGAALSRVAGGHRVATCP
jgi:restriction system protein